MDMMPVAETLLTVNMFFYFPSFHDSAHNGFGMLVNLLSGCIEKTLVFFRGCEDFLI